MNHLKAQKIVDAIAGIADATAIIRATHDNDRAEHYEGVLEAHKTELIKLLMEMEI